jgi:hypothetical protein
MPGSPGGLARIDALFHSNGYTVAFSTAPVVFGAFPSLHAGDATMAALFISHFWPYLRVYAWSYTGILYWATMYLTHHYLIDLVAGACLATAFFYLFIPQSLKAFPPDNTTNSNWAIVNGFSEGNGSMGIVGTGRFDSYDIDTPSNANGNGSFYRAASEDSLSDEGRDAPPNPLTPYGHIRRVSTPLPSPRLGNIVPSVGSLSSTANAGGMHGGGKSHRHTASIASLIHAEERVEEGWSPVRKDFTFPIQSPSPYLPSPNPASGATAPSFAGRIGGSGMTPVRDSSAEGSSRMVVGGIGMADGDGVRARSPSWPTSGNNYGDV